MKKTIKSYRSYIFPIFFFLCVAAGRFSAHKIPKIFTVEIKDMKFVPENITVSKGDTIIWINHDMMAHDVTEEASKTWTSGPIAAGGSWKMTVAGEVYYYCSIHVVMKGKIKLE